MSGETSSRTGRAGGIFVAVVVGGSFVAVMGWHLLSNRSPTRLDESGFDVAAVAAPPRPLAAASAPSAPARPASSLQTFHADAGIRVADGNSSSGSPGSPGSPAARPADKKQEAHLAFQEAVRRNEATVRSFAERMTQKYPVVRQYGRDWMSHPDLRKLNDDYMRDHDPVAFLAGLSKSPNLGPMVKKYAGSPEIREFIIGGLKEAPGELTSAAMGVLQNDRVIKDLIANVAAGLGLPPSVTGLISGGQGPSKIDQNRVVTDIMNSPEARKAMQQNQQTAPVPLDRR